ncbi:hypothetical protein CORC01_13167 [Colletotrichum orchidophilum]|uniref:Uncharacterized protein n=1 Tax=Colletotrichum orchidophilum TaxID=1209926 RepID=A0A1G4AQR9_9PEZI|nr:uncharacterized protein CORC01_13167 [Colletotrichum orchidophilum]OHE91518.1 hypothetical protein CORC01_13167 [Colletotrichum orchidophilum]
MFSGIFVGKKLSRDPEGLSIKVRTHIAGAEMSEKGSLGAIDWLKDTPKDHKEVETVLKSDAWKKDCTAQHQAHGQRQAVAVPLRHINSIIMETSSTVTGSSACGKQRDKSPAPSRSPPTKEEHTACGHGRLFAENKVKIALCYLSAQGRLQAG